MICQESIIIPKREEGKGSIFISPLKAVIFIACLYPIFLVILPFALSAPIPDCICREKNCRNLTIDHEWPGATICPVSLSQFFWLETSLYFEELFILRNFSLFRGTLYSEDSAPTYRGVILSPPIPSLFLDSELWGSAPKLIATNPHLYPLKEPTEIKSKTIKRNKRWAVLTTLLQPWSHLLALASLPIWSS